MGIINKIQSLFGNALDLSPELRNKIQIVTNVVSFCLLSNLILQMDISYDLSSKHIVKSVEQSLINLNVDYLDSLLIHRPWPFDQYKNSC